MPYHQVSHTITKTFFLTQVEDLTSFSSSHHCFCIFFFFFRLLVCLFFVVCVQITTRQDKKEERVTQFVICHCLCKCCGLLNLWLNLCGCGCATGPSLLTNKMMPLYVNLYVSFLIYIRNKKIKLSRWPNKCMCDTPSRRNNFSNPSSLTVILCSALSIPTWDQLTHTTLSQVR